MSASRVAFVGVMESLRIPGQVSIAPDRFASLLDLQLQELAQLAGVHRATVSESPRNARLQGFLRDSLRVLSAATEVTDDPERAYFWFRNVPIREFGHALPVDLVAKGEADALIEYLASIGSGASG